MAQFHGTLRLLHGVAGQLMDRGGKLLYRACLLCGALCQCLGRACDLLGAGVHLRGGIHDSIHGMGQVPLDTVQRGLERRKLANIVLLQFEDQIAVADLVQNAGDLLDVQDVRLKPFHQMRNILGEKPDLVTCGGIDLYVKITLSQLANGHAQPLDRADDPVGDQNSNESQNNGADKEANDGSCLEGIDVGIIFLCRHTAEDLPAGLAAVDHRAVMRFTVDLILHGADSLARTQSIIHISAVTHLRDVGQCQLAVGMIENVAVGVKDGEVAATADGQRAQVLHQSVQHDIHADHTDHGVALVDAHSGSHDQAAGGIVRISTGKNDLAGLGSLHLLEPGAVRNDERCVGVRTIRGHKLAVLHTAEPDRLQTGFLVVGGIGHLRQNFLKQRRVLKAERRAVRLCLIKQCVNTVDIPNDLRGGKEGREIGIHLTSGCLCLYADLGLL